METNHTRQTICVLAVHSYASMLPWITGLHRHFHVQLFVSFCYLFKSLVQRSQNMYFNSSFPTLLASTFGQLSIPSSQAPKPDSPWVKHKCTRQTVERKTTAWGSLFLCFFDGEKNDFKASTPSTSDLNFLFAVWDSHFSAVSGDGGDWDIITSRSKALRIFTTYLRLKKHTEMPQGNLSVLRSKHLLHPPLQRWVSKMVRGQIYLNALRSLHMVHIQTQQESNDVTRV